MSILFLSSAKAYTQDLYYSDSSTATSFNIMGFANITSPTENCSTSIQAYADVINTNGLNKNYQFYLYGNNTLLDNTIYNSNQNATCIAIGSDSIGGGVANATIYFTSLGATTAQINLYLEIHTNCSQVDNVSIVLYDTVSGSGTGNNMYMGKYTSPNVHNQTAINNLWFNQTPSHCILVNNKGVPKTQYINVGELGAYYVPFNSGLGNVSLFFQGASSVGGGGIINLETGLNTLLFNFPISGGTFNLTLPSETDYVAWIDEGIFDIPFNGYIYVPAIRVYLNDYLPNYVCTANNCTNGTRTVTCVDTKGQAPTIISSQPCLPFAEQIFLGFENSYFTNTARCIPGFLCGGLIIQNMTVGYPDNPRWDISDFLLNFPDYNVWFAQMTGEDRSNLTLTGTVQRVNGIPLILNNVPYGSQSLKMWYIPPSPPLQPQEFNATSVICGNTTTGYYPYTTLNGINNSFFASFNFTFPSALMALQFDVKRCTSPVRQYEQCGIPPLGIVQSCFSYLGNCTIPPRGDYYMQLSDLTTATNVILWTDNAPNIWQRQIFDLNGNIQTGHQYQIQLGMNPLDPYSSQGECVYFDNVMIINRADVEACTTANACNGSDRLIQQVVDGVCVSTITQNDPECVTQQEQESGITGNQSIFTPIGSIANSIVNATTGQTFAQSLQAQGMGFVLIFFTPIFWLMLLVIIPMSIVGWWTKHMELGAVAGLLLLIAITTAFPELVFITIVVVIIAGFIIARQVVQGING
jgi:hypothetical protein